MTGLPSVILLGGRINQKSCSLRSSGIFYLHSFGNTFLRDIHLVMYIKNSGFIKGIVFQLLIGLPSVILLRCRINQKSCSLRSSGIFYLHPLRNTFLTAANKKSRHSVPGFLVCRGDWIRTSDLLHPMQARYQAAPHPVLKSETLKSETPKLETSSNQ